MSLFRHLMPGVLLATVFLAFLFQTAVVRTAAAQSEKPPAATGTEPVATNPVDTVKDEITEADIESGLKDLEAAGEADADSTATAKASYVKAKEQIQSAKKLAADVAQFKQLVDAAPEEAARIKTTLEQAATDTAEPSKSDSLTELQAELAEKTTLLKQARDELVSVASEPSRRQARLLELPELIAAADDQQETIEQQLKALDETQTPLLTRARRVELLASLQTVENQIAAFEAERGFYTATTDSLPLQRDLLERNAQQLETEIRRWQSAIKQLRQDEVDTLQRQTADDISDAPEALKPAAEKNVELVAQYQSVSQRVTEINNMLNRSRAQLEAIRSNHKVSRERVEAVGLNDTLGLMLRRSKIELNSIRRKFLPRDDANEEMKQLQVGLFELQDLSSRASVTDTSIEKLFNGLQVPASQRDGLQDDAVQILQQRRDVLTPLVQTQSELLKLTMEHDTTDRLVVAEIDAFTNYINEHILWIRSGPVLGRDDLQSLSQATAWTLDPSNWLALPKAFVGSIQRKFGMFLFLAIAAAGLVLLRRRFGAMISEESQLAKAGACRTFSPTAIALINTVLLAATVPFLLVAIGWMLKNTVADAFVQATSHALIAVGLAIYPFELLRQLCRRDGLGEHHFRWQDGARRFLRANLTWLTPTMAVLLFFVCLIQYQPKEPYRNSLGRLIMLGLIAVWAIYVFKVLHPKSRLYQGTQSGNRNHRWYRFRALTFFAACAIAVGLLLFTLAGYYYSTYQLGMRLIQTHALIVGMTLAYEMAMRWLLIRRRRLKLEQLELRRAELIEKPDLESGISEQVKIEVRAEPGLDANAVSKQTGQLLIISLMAMGAWFGWRIWADVLPAIGILDRIELWPVTVAGVVEKVTLQNLLFALTTVIATFVAVSNLPGILELLLLKRLPMDSGSRYAVSTIVRYVVTLVGCIIAFGFIKVQWSQFSWLVAAISVGLGFGLQEIVANFVSGLILLLERPVRIGDVVTIEGTTGVVSRIQMRATTVTNFDQQELVVPNKNLITNSIFNWTLSNVLTRIVVEVGVEYGADAEFTRQCILDEVKSHPEVLDDPAPSVTFQSFGDNSLNFTARCCISGPDKRLKAIHELHVAIHRRLTAEGIAIPFPQRDLHIVSQPE